jgi:hypothetical protein
MIVSNLEKQEAQIDSLENSHKPNYLSKSVSYEDYVAANRNNRLEPTKIESDINFDVNVISVNSSRFPNEISIDLVIADSNGIYLKKSRTTF